MANRFPVEACDAALSGVAVFRRFVGVFLGAILALILIGSMVRSTGAGLGCPDWPRCFGLWVPPVSVSQLPPDYLLQYDGIPFNPIKTWTEYLNRLSGVVVGLLATGVMLWSFRFWRVQRRWTWLSVAAWVLVSLNGAIGAWVVSSRLVPFVISLHMMLAMLLVGVVASLYGMLRSTDRPILSAASRRYWWFFVVIFLFQMGLGIQLRELMDMANHAGLARIDWLPSAGAMFWVHRSFSWALLAAAGLFFWKCQGHQKETGAILALVITQMLTGVGLAHSGMLFAMQPLHLVLSALTVVVLVSFQRNRAKNPTRQG
jgi:cytochrome c oxidase assembly protein subunit 15